MPIAGPVTSPLTAACTSRLPMIGPVHEKETNERVKAMKKMPINPPRSDARLEAFSHLPGRVVSKAPKKETANTTKMKKNARFIIPLLASAFKASGPRVSVITKPRAT